MSSAPRRLVCPTILRQRFNAMDFPGRIARREVFERVVHVGTPRPAAHQEAGTVAETVVYMDERWRFLARVHQYRKPNGTLGGSGRPDPKVLVVDGETWVADGDPHHHCPSCAAPRPD
jgi:hypothetical protein